jgi:hypothetical protein
MNLRFVLIAYGLANAVLYSAMLPVWEGFDEPFHFGCVQQIASGQGFPDPRSSTLSREIALSLRLAPASDIVHRNLPYVTTWREYFASPLPCREARQARLRELPPASGGQLSDIANYEAQQAPLAYLLLAVPERLLAGVSLPGRLLALRMVCGVSGALLLFLGTESLFREMGLQDPYRGAALFCVLSCQMTWAAIAHVANDWLAVPLAVWSLAMAIRYLHSRRRADIAAAAGLVALGLLTKAYFLALLPIALLPCLALKKWRDLGIAAAVVLAAAGPWYARNLIRYGTLTGMQEARAGIGAPALIRAAVRLDWPRAIAANARAALWTGNSSFLSFSQGTLNAILVVWLIALVLWAAGRHAKADGMVGAYVVLFAAGLVYMTVVSFVYTRGAATGPEPWHAQPLTAPLLGLGFLGCSRSRGPGRAVAVLLAMLFGYVLIATYTAKLIPLYGGYEGRTTPGSLIDLYSRHFAELTRNIGLTALAPAWVTGLLTAVVAVLAVTEVFFLARAILNAAPGDRTCPSPRFRLP